MQIFKVTAAKFSFFLLVTATLETASYADFFHYNNFIPGDRAIGLGGAFVAVSDDASSVAYNPAGMAYSLSPSFSGSANAFYSRRVVYKNTIGTEDFIEKSMGSVPSFFGGIQQIKGIGKGTAIGFAIYSPDSESKSQNDMIQKPELGIRGFHRTINAQSTTTHFGIGAGTRMSSRFSAGVAVNLVKIDDLAQEYQDTTLNANTTGLVLVQEAQDRGALLLDITQNRKITINVLAVEPVLGFQFVPLDNFSIGIAFKQPFIVRQSYLQYVDASRSNRFEDGTPFTSSDIADESAKNWTKAKEEGIKITKQTPSAASEGLPLGVLDIQEPFGGMPAEIRLGWAWFASSRLLFTHDLSYRLAPKEGSIESLNRNEVLNVHLGTEYYLTASLPLRFGLFTNFDSRPDLQSNLLNQQDHIDYYGSSFILTWASRGSQISLGGVGQYGKGQSQKISNDPRIQEVEAFFYSVVLSTSYTL